MKIVELKLKLDNKGEGITAISLVKHPAIEENWIAFNAQGTIVTPGTIKQNQKQFRFKTLDESQRIVAGPAMIPDKLIYRLDEEGEESFVFFKAETIRELSERFLYQGKQNNMTLEHEATLNDLSVIESWIVEDSKRDKSAVYGFNLPVGSWFVKVKVLNDDVWNLVKGKELAGFSVEGVFASELIENSKPMKTTKLDEYLNRIKTLFAEEKPDEAEEEKFGSIEGTNADGVEATINFPGEALAVGAAITHTVDGEEQPLPTGEWTLADGGVLVVTEDGIVGELRVAEAEVVEEEKEDLEKAEPLSDSQMEKLIDNLASVLTNFKKETLTHIETTVKTATDALRVEFNKPAEDPKPETPEKDEKAKIITGLNSFVKQSKTDK